MSAIVEIFIDEILTCDILKFIGIRQLSNHKYLRAINHYEQNKIALMLNDSVNDTHGDIRLIFNNMFWNYKINIKVYYADKQLAYRDCIFNNCLVHNTAHHFLSPAALKSLYPTSLFYESEVD